jgi:hypothetical protein
MITHRIQFFFLQRTKRCTWYSSKEKASMRKIFLVIAFTLLLGVVTLTLFQVVRGQEASGVDALTRETQGENLREITALAQPAVPQEPNIGFIDSPSATCYQPDASVDECFLTWYYLSVDAAPNYMITMTLSLNEIGPIAHTQGFFQTSMYIPFSMLGKGFKVACGALGAGGNPALGNSYSYTIRARDSADLSSANYGTAYCPAFQP